MFSQRLKESDVKSLQQLGDSRLPLRLRAIVVVVSLASIGGLGAGFTAQANASTPSPPAARRTVAFGGNPSSHLGRPLGRSANRAITIDFVARNSTSALSSVVSWLKAESLHPRTQGSAAVVHSTVRRIERVLAVRFHDYRYEGARIYASGEPRVPARLTQQLLAILGLNDVPLAAASPVWNPDAPPAPNPPPVRRTAALSSNGALSPHVSACTAASSYAAAHAGLTLDTVGSHYGVSSLLTAGDIGTGVTVGILSLSESVPADISAYDTCFGLSSANYSVVTVGSIGPRSPPNGYTLREQSEADIDVEQVQTQAPGATVVSYEADNSFQGFYEDLNAMVHPGTGQPSRPQVISISWGLCEAGWQSAGQYGVTAFDALFAEAAAQNQSVFVASGDYGSEDCNSFNSSTSLAVDFPASDPNVTAVGGSVESGSSPDTAWISGGGGISSDLSESASQIAVAGNIAGSCATPSHCRATPDVSANAQQDMAVLMSYDPSQDVVDSNNEHLSPSNQRWELWGGTSFAAPFMAGLAADTDQTCKTPVGNLGSKLYSYYSTYGYGAGLTDVTTGNNDAANAHSGLYAASSGYDMATGLGTPIATGLLCPVVTQLSSSVGVAGSSITITGSNLTVGSSSVSVAFGNASANVTNASATSLTVTLPTAGSGVHNLVLSTAIGAAINEPSFEIDQPAAITSSNATTFVESSNSTFSFAATGYPTPSFQESGALPGGVTFANGQLSGTPQPATAGSYPLTITAHNGIGSDASQSFMLTVSPAGGGTTTTTTTTLPVTTTTLGGGGGGGGGGTPVTTTTTSTSTTTSTTTTLPVTTTTLPAVSNAPTTTTLTATTRTPSTVQAKPGAVVLNKSHSIAMVTVSSCRTKTCSGTLEVLTGKTIVGKSKFSTKKGKKIQVTVRLNAAGQKAAKTGKKLTAKLVR